MPDSSRLADLIVPMPGKIAVLVESKATRTPSGLFIPEDVAKSIHEEKATFGEVIAVGEDDDSSPGIIKVGDVVLFGKYTGTRVKYRAQRGADPEQVIVMNESSVLAILKEKDVAKDITVR